jgi:hypothetical protein
MRLNDPLISSFIYNDKKYSINLAFDNVLDVLEYANSKRFRDHIKAEICLDLLLNEDVKGIEAIELWNFILENFINFEEKQPVEYDLNGNPMPVIEDEEETGSHMSIEQDAEYIFASFQQAYGINLFHEQGKMHWQEFRALLNGLPDNTIMKRIMQIRAWEPGKHDSEETKENMKQLKRQFALREVE